MKVLLLLSLVCASSCWVLFSPIRKTVSEKAYEWRFLGDPAATPWTGPNSFNLERVSLRWSLPPNAYSNEGLASGISFALHRDFCKKLLPLFPESTTAVSGVGDLFLTCTDLRDTVKRAMDTWAINHKKIYFRDVTDQCAHVESLEACQAAELFIVPDDPEGATTTQELAAFVTHNTATIDFNPYTTAGFQLDTGLGVRDAKMTVRAPETAGEFCWYLDTTFCYGFHQWSEADVDVVAISRTIGILLFFAALAIILCIFISACQYTLGKEHVPMENRVVSGDSTINLYQRNDPNHARVEMGQHSDLSENLECGSKKCTNLIDFLSVMPMFTLLGCIFFLIFTPIFYWRIFLPCVDCYDFEATIAHEVGHVLGFHHPDAEWELNLNARLEMNASTCERAMDYVHLNLTEGKKDSIMYSMTTNRDRTCLTADDLEGLNYLYPSCEGAVKPMIETGEPLCIKSKRLSGWLRLMYAVLLPWICVSLFIMLLQSIVRRHQRKRLKSLEAVAAKLRRQRSVLVKKLGARGTSVVKRAGSVFGGEGGAGGIGRRMSAMNRRTSGVSSDGQGSGRGGFRSNPSALAPCAEEAATVETTTTTAPKTPQIRIYRSDRDSAI